MTVTVPLYKEHDHSANTALAVLSYDGSLGNISLKATDLKGKDLHVKSYQNVSVVELSVEAMLSYNINEESLDARVSNNPSVRLSVEINDENALRGLDFNAVDRFFKNQLQDSNL
mgnify:FL=1